jgi:RNA polymerase sigma factor (sigma-70 family)
VPRCDAIRCQDDRVTLPPFERVVELHGPAVLRFCAVRAGSEHAEDCFQETMIAALRAYEQVRDAEAIRSWLFAIAARKAVDGHRARAREPVPAGDAIEASLAARAPATDGAAHDDELWGRVRALPEKQRQAVTLRYLGDLTHREIATVMETSEPAARRNVFEGLERLRKDATR